MSENAKKWDTDPVKNPDFIGIGPTLNNDNHLKHLVIVSGKGGTGKTTLTAAFTKLAQRCVVADCDVDASDLHLVLKPEIDHSYSYSGGKKAVIDQKICSECFLCVEHCRFNAIHSFQVDPLACEGCGFCSRICPENAIRMNEVISGYYHMGAFPDGDFIYAALQPGEGNSGKLVSEVKNRSKSMAERDKSKWFLVDGPPGIGCPVNASLTGADFVLIVTEPTVSGFHDLKRVVQLIQRFRIPSAFVINKFDLNQEMTNRIKTFAKKENIHIAGEIPFDDAVDNALLEGKTVMDIEESPAARAISKIWERVNVLI